MYKKLACLLLSVLCLVSFAGCKQPTKEAEKTPLLIGLPGGHGELAVDGFKAKYGDRYDITTDEGSWSDFATKVKMQYAAKLDVTPVFLTDSLMATSFGGSGGLADLKPYVERDIDTKLYSDALFSISDKNGALWGVPQALDSVGVLYNKDIFDEKGIPYPSEDWTWEEMLDMAKELTFDRDGDGEIDVNGIYYSTNITLGWWPFMRAMGVSPYKDDYRNSNLDDPLVKKAMEAYQQPVLDGVVPDPAVIAAVGSDLMAFSQGMLAMLITQSSAVGPVNKYNDSLNFDCQVTPIGWDGNRANIYVPNVWVVYKDAPDNVKEAAWDWIEYWLSEEIQNRAATEISGMPILKSAWQLKFDSVAKPEHMDAFFKYIDDYGVTILENPTSGSTRYIIDDMCTKIRRQEKTIDESIQTAHSDMQQELDFYYNGLEEQA